MSRRAVIALAVLVAVVAAALVPWTVSSNRIRHEVMRELKLSYGLDAVFSGRTTIAFLPAPRLKFSHVIVANAEGEPLVRGAQMRGTLRLLPLLAGRIEVDEVELVGARLAIEIGAAGRSNWNSMVDALRATVAPDGTGAAPIRRFILRSSALDIHDSRSGSGAVLDNVNALVNWPRASNALDVAGSAVWRGEAVEASLANVRPAALASGRADAVALKIATRHGRVSASGDLTWGQTRRFAGQISGETDSVSTFVNWLSPGAWSSKIDRAFSFGGDVGIDRDGASWPRIRLSLGEDRFDGALALRLEEGRPSVRATLAGDRLDLGWLLAGAGSPQSSEGEIRFLRDAVAACRLDLRVSASEVLLGATTARDVAMGLLAANDRLEVSLGRLTLASGVVKGRISGTFGDPSRIDVRGQATFDKLDVGEVLAGLTAARPMTGKAAGQVSFETVSGPTSAVLPTLTGRLNLSIKGGDIQGLALGSLLRRAETGPAGPVGSGWRGGRTPFDQAQFLLAATNGVAQISEGNINGPNLHTSVGGRISLPDRTLDVRLTTGPDAEASEEPPAAIVDVSGSWSAPSTTLRLRPADGAKPDAARPNAATASP